jgi:hypothetical protein
MSLSARLILLLTIAVGAIMILGGYFILRQREAIHERALRSELYAHAITLRLTLEDIHRAGRIGDAQRLIARLSENPQNLRRHSLRRGGPCGDVFQSAGGR